MNFHFFSLLFLIFQSLTLHLSAEGIASEPNEFSSIYSSFEKIPTQDSEWDVFCTVAAKTYDSSGFSSHTRELLKNPAFSRPTAIFVYGTSQTIALTNRTVWIQEAYDPRPFEYEDGIVSEYLSFLARFCRVPFSKNYDHITGTFIVGFDELKKVESSCEKKLISRTWKGKGIGFAIHIIYDRIWTGTIRQGETRLQSVLTGLFQFLPLIILIWVLFFVAFRIIRFYHKMRNPIENSIVVSAVAVLSVGLILMASLFVVSSLLHFSMGYSDISVSRDLMPPGWRHYATNAVIISTFYSISCILPFAGIINYCLLDKKTFPIWLILLGFILAPILFILFIFAMGGKRSPGTTSSRSGNSDSSSSGNISGSGGISGGGGTFGGGGASGKW